MVVVFELAASLDELVVSLMSSIRCIIDEFI